MPFDSILNNKFIAIIHPNYLISCGLKSLLENHFSATNTTSFSGYEEYLDEKDNTFPFHFIFIHSEAYALYYEQLKSLKNKLIILTGIHSTSSSAGLNINLPKDEIIQNLRNIFSSKIKEPSLDDNQDSLSAREIDVLKCVALGLQNKQIAEQLCISSHTVVSHRKNITRKLGLNSVSGLTVYALINGLITSEDIQHH